VPAGRRAHDARVVGRRRDDPRRPCAGCTAARPSRTIRARHARTRARTWPRRRRRDDSCTGRKRRGPPGVAREITRLDPGRATHRWRATGPPDVAPGGRSRGRTADATGPGSYRWHPVQRAANERRASSVRWSVAPSGARDRRGGGAVGCRDRRGGGPACTGSNGRRRRRVQGSKGRRAGVHGIEGAAAPSGAGIARMAPPGARDRANGGVGCKRSRRRRRAHEIAEAVPNGCDASRDPAPYRRRLAAGRRQRGQDAGASVGRPRQDAQRGRRNPPRARD
jgi:hypothetical protein